MRISIHFYLRIGYLSNFVFVFYKKIGRTIIKLLHTDQIHLEGRVTKSESKSKLPRSETSNKTTAALAGEHERRKCVGMQIFINTGRGPDERTKRER